jgi:hypothetical protein
VLGKILPHLLNEVIEVLLRSFHDLLEAVSHPSVEHVNILIHDG